VSNHEYPHAHEYTTHTLHRLLHDQGVQAEFVRFFKQGAVQLALRRRGLQVVLDLRDSEGINSPSLRFRQDALEELAYYSYEHPNITFAGFVTDKGYETAPLIDRATFIPSDYPQLLFQQLDEETWKFDWQES
jgi:hypothetical protein